MVTVPSPVLLSLWVIGLAVAGASAVPSEQLSKVPRSAVDALAASDDSHIKQSFEVVATPDVDGLSVHLSSGVDDDPQQTSDARACDPTDLCEEVYKLVRTNLPGVVTDIISTLAIIPPVTYRIVFDLALDGTGVYAEAFMACWACNIQGAFGRDPSAATVHLDGEVQGDIFFAQTLERQDKPAAVTVVGAFTGLVPQQRYKVTVHKSGDVDAQCAYVGEEFSELGGAFFTADAEGEATLMMQDTSVLIDGDVSLLGRSIVVSPINDASKKTCGVVIRNIVPQEQLNYRAVVQDTNINIVS